jgi:hypothetical protein
MQTFTNLRWRELVERASHERDPDKLIEIILELNKLMAAKYDPLAPASEARSMMGSISFSPKPLIAKPD